MSVARVTNEYIAEATIIRVADPKKRAGSEIRGTDSAEKNP
jgi:hypothetical protein